MDSNERQPFFWPTEAEKTMLGGLVDEVVAVRAEMAALQARETKALAAASALADAQTERIASHASKLRDMPRRAVAAELALAVRVSDRSMQRMLDDSATLTGSFPATLAALSDGTITRAHARVIVDAGRVIDDSERRAEFEAAAVIRAERKTVGQLRRELKLLADRMQRRTMSERHRAARDDRFVRVNDLDDGMAELVAVLPAVLAHGIHDRLTQQGKAIQDAARAPGVPDSGSDAGESRGDAGDSEDDADSESVDSARSTRCGRTCSPTCS